MARKKRWDKRKVIGHPLVYVPLSWLLVVYMWVTFKTSRVTIECEPETADILRNKKPMLAFFWHERIALMPPCWPALFRHLQAKQRTAYILSSLNADAEAPGRTIEFFHMERVRGSPKQGWIYATKTMLRLLRSDNIVVITADGPKGPRHQLAMPLIKLAKRSEAPVVPFMAASSRMKILRKTWDRTSLPLPFGHMHFMLKNPVPITGLEDEEALSEVTNALNNVRSETLRAVGRDDLVDIP